MSEFDDKLSDHSQRLRRLTSDLHQLEKAQDEPSKKLRMLLLKRDFEDLIRDMRETQEDVGQTISRSNASARAASAYVTQAAFLARSQRS